MDSVWPGQVPGGSLPSGPLRRLSQRARPSPRKDLWPTVASAQEAEAPALPWLEAWLGRSGQAQLVAKSSQAPATLTGVLSLTGSDPQDPREELGVSAPSPFPARLACTTKLEKQFPSAPPTRAQPRSTSDFCGTGAGEGCPSPWLPVPLAPRRNAVLASPLLGPLRARPRGTRDPLRAAGDPCTFRWESPGVIPGRRGGMEPGGSLQVSVGKNNVPGTWMPAPHKRRARDSAGPSGTVSSCAEKSNPRLPRCGEGFEGTLG